MTSRRLVSLFFLFALIARECLEFPHFILLSLSCRHCGNSGGMVVVSRNERSIDDWEEERKKERKRKKEMGRERQKGRG